jgi:DNA cross-link repair 1B protein
MVNHKDPDGINYIVPYSLHSNFEEMRTYVKALQPGILRRLVLEIYHLPQFRKEQKIQFRMNYLSYLKNLGKTLYSGCSG